MAEETTIREALARNERRWLWMEILSAVACIGILAAVAYSKSPERFTRDRISREEAALSYMEPAAWERFSRMAMELQLLQREVDMLRNRVEDLEEGNKGSEE